MVHFPPNILAVISVVVPVKNEGAAFAACLDAIRSQVVDADVEIVVVDSGSTDGSVDRARAAGACVIEIPPHEFNHGGSRNLAAGRARGDILVFTTGDAVAVDDQWLARLIAPLRADPQLGGVYGRQLPNHDATPPEAYFLNFLYGSQPRRQRATSIDELSMDTTLFSNVNSAMPRAVWEQFPFPNDIIMSEDQDWSRRVLLSGREIVYEPRAAVRHSHAYTLRAAFRRFFDSGASSSRAYMAGRRHSFRVLGSAASRYALGEVRWLWRTGQGRWIPYAVLYESAKMSGLLAGVNHERIPLVLKRRMSRLPIYWEGVYA